MKGNVQDSWPRLIASQSGQGELAMEAIELKAQAQDQRLVNELLRNLVLKYADAERRLARLNRELQEKQAQLEEDLRAAGEIQLAMVPREPMTDGQFVCHWTFIPCESVAGDVFQVFPLTDHVMAFYIIDVTGHGVPAAMVATSASQYLRPFQAARQNLEKTEMLFPLKVMEALEREFPMGRFNKLFSIIYGVVDLKTRQVRYVNCGHPYPAIFGGREKARFIEESGPLVGMEMPELFQETRLVLEPGDNMLFYSDGITECRNARQELFGEPALLRFLDAHTRCAPRDLVPALEEQLREFRGDCPFPDDVTFFVFSLGD